MNIRIYIWIGMYAYTHTDTNICKITGISLSFILSFLINNNSNINSLNHLLLNYWTTYIGSIGPVILVNIYMLSVQVMKSTIKLLPLLAQHLTSRAIKQLNEQITTAILNFGRWCNISFHTHVITPSSIYGHIDCSTILHRSGSSHTRLTQSICTIMYKRV